jgi:hypothetical protein
MRQHAPEPFRLTRFRVLGFLIAGGLTALLAWATKAAFAHPSAAVAVTLITATLASGFAAIAFLLPLEGPPIPTSFGGKGYVLIGDLVRDVATLTGLRADHEPAWYPTLESVRLDGDVAGRRASVTFFTEIHPETYGRDTVCYCVRLATPAEETPWLRVTQESVLTKVAKALGLSWEVEIGDAEFDARFLLVTDRKEPASNLLRGEVRGAIARIFDLGARDLSFEKGEIAVTARVEAVDLASYRLILEGLARIARTIDRKTLAVRVLGGDRRALVDESGRTRCPYCRENLGGDEDDLVACEKCATVLHDDCWKEHGRCPLLGCSGRSPERARTS